MGKVRLECPHCGKAIRVPDSAKKAKCPGCKKVIEVASALAEAGGEKPKADAGEKVEPEAPKAPEEPAEAEPEGQGAEVATPSKRPSKRSSKRLKEAAKTPPKAAPTVAGVQSWMIVAGASVVIFVVLFFYLQWWAALMIASAVGVYADASLCRITRVGPSSAGSSLGPTIWGLIAFALVVGPVIYVILRSRLMANSQEDIAEAGATDEDLEETGKIRPPSIASPGVVLVLAGVVGLGAMFQKPESLTVKLGTKFSSTTKKIGGSNKRNMFDSKKPFHVVIDARKDLDEEEYKTLTYVVFPEGGDEESPVVRGEASWDEEVAKPGKKKRIWHWTVQVDEAGLYVLRVMRASGKVFVEKEFRIRSVR